MCICYVYVCVFSFPSKNVFVLRKWWWLLRHHWREVNNCFFSMLGHIAFHTAPGENYRFLDVILRDCMLGIGYLIQLFICLCHFVVEFYELFRTSLSSGAQCTLHTFFCGGLTSSPRAVTKCNRSNNCIISRIQALTDGTCNLHHFHVENTFAESFCVFNFDHNYDFVSW